MKSERSFKKTVRKKHSRLPPSVFKIPTDKLRTGYYSDRYFINTRDVLIRDKRSVCVDYQFFSRRDAVVCGLDEAVAILKTCAGLYKNPDKAKTLYAQLREIQWKLQHASAGQKTKDILRWQKKRVQVRQKLNNLWQPGWDQLKVYARRDGERIKKNDTVLVIQGDPRLFVHLETVLLGVIARPTATATQVARVVRAAKGKPLFLFSARFDHYWIQATDGYAAFKAGAFGVSTDANADYWGAESMGTIPHFLIGAYQGRTTDAFHAFDRFIDAKANRIALVDWDNDCIGTTRKLIEDLVRKRLGKIPSDKAKFRREAARVIGAGRGKLWGVRFDNSGSLRDKSVKGKNSFGVCPELVRLGRKAFDDWGCKKLKIIVSGGFDEKKIRDFQKRRVPADAYGVGSSLLRERIDMTADVVGVNGRPCAKVGRKKRGWKALKQVR